jgi:hypothetical protein
MKRKSMKRKSMKRKSMKRKSMKRKSMKRKSMKRKSMKPKQQKGGLIEDDKSYDDQRKLNGAKARLAFSKLALTESEEIVSLPLELINMIGLHIKYEIHMIDKSLSYREQLEFLLPRLRERSDYIFFNNYINDLFRKEFSKKISERDLAKIKLFSIYPEIDLFEESNTQKFFEIGDHMDNDGNYQLIIEILNHFNKIIVKNKLKMLCLNLGEGRLSLSQIYHAVKEYSIYDEPEDDKEMYRTGPLWGFLPLSKKQDIESLDYQLTDVYGNDQLLDHLVKLDTLGDGLVMETKPLKFFLK